MCTSMAWVLWVWVIGMDFRWDLVLGEGSALSYSTSPPMLNTFHIALYHFIFRT